MSFPISGQPGTPKRYRTKKSHKVTKARPADAAAKLELLHLEDRLVPAGQITGQVFVDYNSNGLLDTTSALPNDGFGTYNRQTDIGVGSVVVTAYDPQNVVRGVATTAANGTYTLVATGTGAYRLEFTNVPNVFFTGPQGTNNSPPPVGSSTSVQFVPDGNSTNRNLSLSQSGGYSDNPQIVTNQYFIGDQTGTLPRMGNNGGPLGFNDYSTTATIISFPYSAGTTNQNSSTDPAASAPTTHALAVQSRYVGATWGLAENTKTQTILASSFTKKHVGYGPNGPGAIYTMGTTGTTASLWLDLGSAAVGGNFRSGYTDNNDYFRDSGDVGWDAVGKTSFGGLAINDANTEVYVMNLFDRRLYTIQVNPDGSAGAVTSILIPVPNNATGNVAGANRGDLRPFAVEYRNGLVYVGMVNTAESTRADNQLRGYVYTYNPQTQTWSNRSVINESSTSDGFALNYNRASSFGGSDTFKAWKSTFGNVNAQFNPLSNNAVKYPQPILSGLSFDAAGNLNIAIRDRAGDQLGNQVPSNPADPTYNSSTNTQLYLGISAGELLKATTNNNGTWTLENNATAGGNTSGGINDNAGPGGGEFFFQDDYNFGTHTEVSSGAVANAPGFPDTISTVFDPIRFGETRTAGIRFYSDANGQLSKSYQIYDNTTPGTFGKATGLGDLLVVLPPQGREIGNRVFNDSNANGRQDSGESGIQNVQVILNFNGNPLATATTDANGEYYFSSNAGASTANKKFGLNLEQTGAYVIAIPVAQGPLAGLSVTTNDINTNSEDIRDSDFVLNANTDRAEFTVPALAAGQSDHTFDAGFRPPNNAQLSGFVYQDNNNNGLYETGPGEPSISGVTVVLTGIDGNNNPITPRTTTTDASGFYQFTGLIAGTYTVTETQPAAYLDGRDTPGSLGGSNAVNDVLSGIVLPASGNSINNNFGELLPAALNGFVYIDADNDGLFQNTETPIPGTTVVLTGTNDLGAIAPQTLTTSNTGFYSFTGLRPGTYAVTETQPAGFADGKDTPGVPGGGSAAVNDVISAIALTPGLTSPNNNFGEQQVSQLSGYVYRDPNNNGLRENGETGIGATTVVLTGTVNGNAITPQTITTGANGFYQFTNLRPGTYTVTETQPAGFLDGRDTPGSKQGSNAVNDVLSGIVLVPNDNAVENNFGELLPAQLGGFVYLDANNDGVFQNTETPIANVRVILTGTNDLGAIPPRTVSTAANGSYSFTNLRPGTYRVAETQPTAYSDGRDTPAVVGGGTSVTNDVTDGITLTAGLNSTPNNFGERLLPGSISGYVYRDPDVNGIRQPSLGETGIPGTPITLYREVNGVATAIANAFTSSDGFYQFTNLASGNYRVAETQPAGFYDGLDTPGSTGGNNSVNDVLIFIPIASGQASLNNNFGEVPSVNLFGYVWIDQNRNALFDPGETPIPNAVVTISGTAFAGTPIANTLTPAQSPAGISIITDANGRYDFFKLPPGSYSLAQTNTPAGLQDFASQNAAPGLPIQLSSTTTFSGIGLNSPAPGPLNFGKVFDPATSPPPSTDPSKESFLGSTLGVTAAAQTGNPLVGAPTVVVNTTPTFAVSNTLTGKPVYVAAGAGAGFSPTVRVFDYRTGVETFRFNAFDPSFLGGVTTAIGDVNGDGTQDIIVAAGPGAGPHVKVFDGITGAEIRSFFAFDPSFKGGTMIASGDVDGDGFADIIVSVLSQGPAHVKVFSGKTGVELQSFIAFDTANTTGARVAAGDIDGDGKADIIVGTSEGTQARVRAFKGTNLSVLSDQTVFAGFEGGIYVAAGDFDGDGKADIVVGAGVGNRVAIYNSTGGELASFFGNPDQSILSGSRVAVRDLNGDGLADVITGAGIGTASRITAFSGAGFGPIEDFYLFDSGVRTGIFVG